MFDFEAIRKSVAGLLSGLGQFEDEPGFVLRDLDIKLKWGGLCSPSCATLTEESDLYLYSELARQWRANELLEMQNRDAYRPISPRLFFLQSQEYEKESRIKNRLQIEPDAVM